MTAQAADGPFLWNVAGLLGDAVGADRDLRHRRRHDRAARRAHLAEPINGQVRLIHDEPRRPRPGAPADRARGRVRPLPAADRRRRSTSASRRSSCRRSTSPPARPSPTDEEPEALRLTDHHELDLEPSVRDAISLAEPIAPLDRPTAPACARPAACRSTRATHDHPDDDIDPRLEALRGFKARDARTDGRRDRFAVDSAVGAARAPSSRAPIAAAAAPTTTTTRSPRPHGCTQATRLARPPGRAPLAPRDRPARRSRSVRTATR